MNESEHALKGLFITLEGGEGAGKSTQAQALRRHFEARGQTVTLTREPGGSPLAEGIRQLVLADWPEGINATTELLLMFAARAAHLSATIIPALARGEVVISDRFVDASWAYQGAGRGVAAAQLHTLEQWVLGEIKPDLTLLFDLDPAIGLVRTQRRGDQNRFEAEAMSFQNAVRSAYLQRAAQAPGRYAVIDASQDPAAVTTSIHAALARLLP